LKFISDRRSHVPLIRFETSDDAILAGKEPTAMPERLLHVLNLLPDGVSVPEPRAEHEAIEDHDEEDHPAADSQQPFPRSKLSQLWELDHWVGPPFLIMARAQV
jgi:hypothetical protein